jgi:hypothetical protein
VSTLTASGPTRTRCAVDSLIARSTGGRRACFETVREARNRSTAGDSRRSFETDVDAARVGRCVRTVPRVVTRSARDATGRHEGYFEFRDKESRSRASRQSRLTTHESPLGQEQEGHSHGRTWARSRFRARILRTSSFHISEALSRK